MPWDQGLAASRVARLERGLGAKVALFNFLSRTGAALDLCLWMFQLGGHCSFLNSRGGRQTC